MTVKVSADGMDNVGKASADRERQEAPLSDGELIQRLHLRAADCRQKSMTARLVAVIDGVEALLARGYDRSQLLEILVEVGWHFTTDSFDSALRRVRKRQSEAEGGAGRTGKRNGAPGCQLDRGDSPRRQTETSEQAANIALRETTPESSNGPRDGSFASAFLEGKRPLGMRRWK